MVNIYYTNRFLLHDTGYGHPERPERLEACVRTLQHPDDPLPDLRWVEPRRAHKDELELVHTPAHILNVQKTAEHGGFSLDSDTPVSPESYDIALQSAGAWLDGVDAVLAGESSAFVLSRPPGHHAERDYGAGFCLFSNCALAAHYARHEKKIDRVAVVDWDVHHGNGTQHILETEKNMAYCSLHQWPFYPGTGASHETGDYNNVVNIPLPAGSGRSEYLTQFESRIIPFLRAWEPELLIISAGFDASRNDPLGGMFLDPEDFADFTRFCLDVSPRLLVGLEGGYHLGDLAASVKAVIQVLNEN